MTSYLPSIPLGYPIELWTQTTEVAYQQLNHLSAYLWNPMPPSLVDRQISQPDEELPKVRFLDSESNSSLMQETFTIFDDYNGTDRNC